jgi:hypothetical protein
MAKFLRIIFWLLLAGLLCLHAPWWQMEPSTFAKETPVFRPEEFFAGKVNGTGVFYDRFGRLQARFKLALDGVNDNGVLRLKEVLTYSNGDKMERDYEIRREDDHHYRATTPDMIGGARIEAYGNVLKWTYTLRQDISGQEWLLDFDDWMFLEGDGIVLNRAYAKKFGFGIGEIQMVLRKQS